MAEELRALLDRVKKNSGLSLLFKKLWEDAGLAEMFLLHREQLFHTEYSSAEMKAVLPFLFWSNLPESVERSILETFSQLEEIRRQQAWKELRLEQLLGEMKDIFAYAAVEVFRSNEDLRRLVEDKDFSFDRMKSILGDYSKINFDALKQIDMGKVPQLDNIMKAVTLNFLRTFDPTKYLETFSRTTGILTSFFLEGARHQGQLLNLLQSGLHEYTRMVGELYVLKLISNFQTAFWCEHCLDSPQIFVTASSIDPDHLQMNCLKCGNFMMVSAIYEIDSLLKECIFLKDGILAVALAWLFDEEKIRWEFSTHNEYENDFMCTTELGGFLFECKMHLIPKDKRSFEGQLKQDLTQLFKHVKTLADEGVELVKTHLVYNYDLVDYEDQINTIMELPKFAGKIDRYNIELIGPFEVVDTIEGIKYP